MVLIWLLMPGFLLHLMTRTVRHQQLSSTSAMPGIENQVITTTKLLPQFLQIQ